MPQAALAEEINIGSVTVSAANAGVMVVGRPVRLIRIKGVVTTALTTAPAIMTLALQQADATATTPTGAALATMTITHTLGIINSVHYMNVDEVYGDLVAYPGERIALTSNAGPGAGAVNFFFEVEPLSFTDVQQRGDGVPGSTDLATALAGVNKVIA